MALDIAALLAVCAPLVHPATAWPLVQVESSFNPNAIAVLDGVLDRQPGTPTEAVATARALLASGWHISGAGLGQINMIHWPRLGLTVHTVFDPCANLRAMQTILGECYERASARWRPPAGQAALRAAFSCYESGNFRTGFEDGYVVKVIATSATAPSWRPARLAHPGPSDQQAAARPSNPGRPTPEQTVGTSCASFQASAHSECGDRRPTARGSRPTGERGLQ